MQAVAQDPRPIVLIVDDEALFRTSVADALAAAQPSYTVLQAVNGRDALELVDRGSMGLDDVNVIVTDISMPVMDGLELMLALRERRFRGAIIVVTAFGNPRLESELTQRGAFSFVDKPIELPQLVEEIRNAAEGQHSLIEGLPLAGFVQLLVLEQKTCRLRVCHGARQGDLHFLDGTLTDASLGRLTGDAAALELLAWDEGARLELHIGVRSRGATVKQSLNQLLLEAMHQKDEKQAGRAPTVAGALATNLVADLGDRLERAMKAEGAIGIALVDHVAGTVVAEAGDGDRVNLEVAAAGNAEVIRSKMQTIEDLELDDTIEDILISLGTQYHLIRPLRATPHLHLYFALQRDQANLALAREELTAVERELLL